MTYAIVNNGKATEFVPFKHGFVPRGAYLLPLESDPLPAFDPLTHTVVADYTVRADKVERSYRVEALPAEQVAINQRRVADESEKVSVKADAFVQSFIEMTPAQVAVYVDTNVTDFASLRNIVKKALIILLLLAKREFR